MTVYTESYAAPSLDKREILRCAGVKNASEITPELSQLLDECLGDTLDRLSYKVCYAEFPITFHADRIDLGFTQASSASLRKNLEGCRRIVLFAATVGITLDRMIARAGRTSPAKALLYEAIGSERIESLCDTFQATLGKTKPRFSPGYGGLPIELQRDIFGMLECSKRIGLTLNGSLLMSPSKSVTAIVGVL